VAMRRSVLLAASLAVCLAAALAGVAWLLARSARQAAAIERLERENRQLAARVTGVPGAPAPRPAPEAAPSAPPMHHPPVPAIDLGQAAQVERLKASLAEANSGLAQLEARIQDFQVQVQKLTVDNQRLAASEADLNDNLSSANRLIDAQQRELKSKGDRVIQLEVANQKLRDDGAAASARLAQLAQISTELQELHRRRDNLLNGVLRRYREITDQYRAMAGSLDSRAHGEAPAVAATDVARIQNSLSLAEDDLRQLNNLSAQALRLQKKMAAR